MRVPSLRAQQPQPPKPGASLATLSLVSLAATLLACTDHRSPTAPASRAAPALEALLAGAPLNVPAQGQYIFRHWTFGDEPFWTDTLHLNQVVEAAVSPAAALAIGLKVDADRLPPGFLASADLTSPATTVELLRRDAVVGVEADVTAAKHIKSLGITCALCHSTVDNSVTVGVGRRLDGWPNRDLNVGAIVSLGDLASFSSLLGVDVETVRKVLTSWGPGKYDAELNHDRISNPVVIPPAFGLRGVALETYTGEGPVSYWNDYVAVTQMHGHGSFSDPALGIAIQQTPDRVTPVLPVLRAYQLSLNTPPAARKLRSGRRRAGAGVVQRNRPMRQLPHSVARVHRRQSRNPARSGRNGHGSGARQQAQEPPVPHHTAAGAVAAPAVLPRWERGDAARRGRALRRALRSRAVAAGEGGLGGISEVALGGRLLGS